MIRTIQGYWCVQISFFSGKVRMRIFDDYEEAVLFRQAAIARHTIGDAEIWEL